MQFTCLPRAYATSKFRGKLDSVNSTTPTPPVFYFGFSILI